MVIAKEKELLPVKSDLNAQLGNLLHSQSLFK